MFIWAPTVVPPTIEAVLDGSDGGFWDRVGEWFRTTGITIGVILIVALVLTKVVSLVAKRQARKFSERQRLTTDPRTSTVGAHQQALMGALRWAINFSIVFMAIIWVLIELNLPSTAVVPLASVVGAGLGFGAQQIVGDVLSGMFILSERQFGVGDLVRVGPLMGVGWVEGHVEEMTLRVTKLRTFDGDLVTIANGELRQSVNASRDWARVLIKVPLGRDVDLDEVAARLDEVGAAMAIEPQWAPIVLEAPKVSGLDDLGADSVHMRVVGRTLPAQQWKVARELRRRIALALRAMDVKVRPSEEPNSLAADDD
ncbi:MAG: mechanosensitive ion channel family protein [Actinobacteria bacterium]|nr:mechanosensitive ion channel family protein [Actinomycetota bacterium]